MFLRIARHSKGLTTVAGHQNLIDATSLRICSGFNTITWIWRLSLIQSLQHIIEQLSQLILSRSDINRNFSFTFFTIFANTHFNSSIEDVCERFMETNGSLLFLHSECLKLNVFMKTIMNTILKTYSRYIYNLY